MQSNQTQISSIVSEYLKIISDSGLDNQILFSTDKFNDFVSNKTGVLLELNDLFTRLVSARNKLANEAGFKNYFQFIFTKYSIDDNDYSFFKNNVNKLNDFFDNSNESLFPDYFNHLNINYDDPLEYLFNFDNKLLNLKDSIDIVDRNSEHSHIDYPSDINGKYRIFLAKSNKPQELSFLIHELCHAKSRIDIGFPKSVYEDELRTLRYEFELDKLVSPDLYTANVKTYAHMAVNVSFLKNIFTNPNIDFPETYLSSRVNVMGTKSNVFKHLYLFDKGNIMKPLFGLASVVAMVKVLYSD